LLLAWPLFLCLSFPKGICCRVQSQPHRRKRGKVVFRKLPPMCTLKRLNARLNAFFLGATSIVCSACSRKLTQVGHPPFWMPAGNLPLSTTHCRHRTCKAQYIVVGVAKNDVFPRNLGRKNARRKCRCPTHTMAVFNSPRTGGTSCDCPAIPSPRPLSTAPNERYLYFGDPQ